MISSRALPVSPAAGRVCGGRHGGAAAPAKLPRFCVLHQTSGSARGNEREIGMDSGVAVLLFAFAELESNSSSEMNEFEGNCLPEPYLPNEQ